MNFLALGQKLIMRSIWEGMSSSFKQCIIELDENEEAYFK